MKVILASQSPRRKDLMRYITSDFESVPAQIDETMKPIESPKDYVVRMAYDKALKVSLVHATSVIIGSDTIVVCDDEVLGKPQDNEEAFRMLSLLSGRKHQVLTAVAIITPKTVRQFVSTAEVTFYELTSDEIVAYIETGEPMDKAGAYGIQGRGSLFVSEIKGDYYSIVGLPVAALKRHLMSVIEGE